LDDGVLVDVVVLGKLHHRCPGPVGHHKVVDVSRFQPVLHLLPSSQDDPWRSLGKHLKQVMEAFPLVSVVRITSAHLHAVVVSTTFQQLGARIFAEARGPT